MPNEEQQTLCVTKSEVYAVQSAPDCSNLNEVAQTSQASSLYSGKITHDIVRKIPLSNGGFALIDEADYHLVKDLKWRVSNHGYVFSSKGVLMHRLILGIHGLGRTIETDHINHDTLDNRRSNLRIVTRSVNQQNRRKFKGEMSSHFTGVKRSANGKRWLARIYHNGKTILLHTHDTEEQAAAAYDKAALALFGPLAALNFPRPSPDRRAA